MVTSQTYDMNEWQCRRLLLILIQFMSSGLPFCSLMSVIGEIDA